MEFRSSEFTDAGERYITPTDVKQYVFCPRVTYFTKVMRVKPIMGSQQKAGQKSHDKLVDLEKRRKSLLKSNLEMNVDSKEYDVDLRSEYLGVQGRLDMLVMTAEGEPIPVEFKNMKSNKGNVHIDHKYQVIVLALLVEENMNKIVRQCLVHYLPEDKTVQLPITSGLKRRAKFYLNRIAEMLREEALPKPRRGCSMKKVGCGFADRCKDI